MPQNRFRQLREEHGLSQIELGNRLGVTQQSVFAWEHGKTVPQIQTAIMLSQLYNVSLDYLMGLSDDPDPKKPTASDSGLKASTIERVRNLPEPVLEKLLDLMDLIQSRPESDSASAVQHHSSSQSDSE